MFQEMTDTIDLSGLIIASRADHDLDNSRVTIFHRRKYTRQSRNRFDTIFHVLTLIIKTAPCLVLYRPNTRKLLAILSQWDKRAVVLSFIYDT